MCQACDAGRDGWGAEPRRRSLRSVRKSPARPIETGASGNHNRRPSPQGGPLLVLLLVIILILALGGGIFISKFLFLLLLLLLILFLMRDRF